MGRLVYSVITSLDGYVVDAEGSFAWAEPDAEVHAFVNDRERSVGTYLYGRRLYEVMSYWATAPTSGSDTHPVEQDYARVWQDADKVVYSTTADRVDTPRTRLERSFEPEAVRELVGAAEHDVSIGGPELAGHALTAGLVDEVALFLAPVVVGGGRHYLPGGVRLELELAEERRFAGGFIWLRYLVRGTG